MANVAARFPLRITAYPGHAQLPFLCWLFLPLSYSYKVQMFHLQQFQVTSFGNYAVAIVRSFLQKLP